MSDHTKMMKRLLLPALISSALAIPAQANTIRIMGPSDEQAAPSPYTPSSVQQPYASENRYGPTTHQETLWSIASRYRPNDQISIYQVIGAIFRNNPQAFEQNNIHGLVPGSILTIPTLSQIQRESVDAVKQRLEADKGQIARVAANKPKPVPAKAPAPAVVKAEPAPAPKAAPKAEPKPASRPVQEPVQEPVQKSVQETEQKAAQPTVSADETARSLIPQKPKALQDQLDASDEQMTKLLESNHLLRVRLAEMQHEVAALKNQISDDEQLREQIKGFIEQQKALQQAKPTEPELTTFDRIIDNPLALAAMALIPGGLLAALAAFLLWGRKKEEEEPLDALEAPHDDETAMVPSPVDNEVVPNLALGDDDDLDDLFSDDDPLFSNDTDNKSDLDDELFEMESGFGPSSISVKGDEEAIGLEDMERALDEIEQKADLSSDEALAAMWEKSLQVEDDEDGFDLSFDSDALDLDRPDAFSPDLADDLPKETAARRPEVEPDQENLISQDDLDSLFDSFVADDMDDAFDKPAAFDNPAAAADSDALKREEDDRAQQAAIDQALAEAEDMFSLSSQDDIDDLFSANSTSLLDELMDEEEDDALTSDITLEEDSTALLDELLGDLEDDDFPSTSIALEENSTELLDELMADLDEDDDDASTLDWPEMDDPEFESPSAPMNADFERDLRDAYQQGEQPGVASDVNAETKLESQPAEGNASENAVQADIPLAAPVAAAATAIAVDEVLADELFTQVTERDLTVSDSVESTPSLDQPEPDIASEPDIEPAPAPVQEPEPEPELEPEGSFDVDTSAFTVESESQHDNAFVSDEDMFVPESTFAPESEPELVPEPAVAEGYVAEDPVAESVAEPVVEQAVEPVSVDADAEQESELAEMPAQPEVTETADIEPDVLPQTEASEPVPATPYGSDDEQAELEALLAASFTEEDAAAMDPSVGMTVEQLLESLDVNAPLDLSDYPEFDEEAAMNAPDAELDDTPQMDVSPDEEQAVFDNIVRQLQQAAEAAERPQT
ncbi:FimV/HubP family polar landmark protein, partial [Photobacterium aphoticum]